MLLRQEYQYFLRPSVGKLLSPTSVGERTSGYDKMNYSHCKSQTTSKQPITITLKIRIPIGFLTYDRIDVIETAVTLSVYLNLSDYRV